MDIISSSMNTSSQQRAWFNIDMQGIQQHHPDSGYDLFHDGRNSPESLQAYDPVLGGYIIQIKITSSMQVPCRCKHAPWHLGANARSFLTHLIEDPTHHIVMSRPLGATNCSCQR